mgnify:CR=1 FL=1
MEQNKKRIDDIIKKLIEMHTTISTIESCTSGMIASMITDTEGASAIFPGGFVTYLNETKILIGVDEKVIEENVQRQWRKRYRKSCTRILPLVSRAQLEMLTRIMPTVYRGRCIFAFGLEIRRTHLNCRQRWRI